MSYEGHSEYHNNPREVINADMGLDMTKRTDKLGRENVELALQVKQAREFLDWSCDHIKRDWLDWIDESKKALSDTRELRMALGIESKQILSLAKDVTSTFNSPDYQSALKQFDKTLELLREFKNLQQDGTVAAFCEFALKMICK